MAVKVGELYALLRLDDAKFKQSLKDAERQMGDLAKKSSAAFALVAGSITAATVAAANYGDEMLGISRQTGLAVETVQALGFAASQANASLGLLTTGMRAFVRRAAEAADGNESFLKTFRDLGFTQAEVRDGLADIDDFLLEVTDRIAALSTEAEQSAVAMNIMSDAGRQLVPFLQQGRRAIEETMQRAREMGIVMGRDTIRDLSAFSDEWSATQQQIAAAGRTLAVEFLPTMRAALNLIEQGSGIVQSMSAETRALVGVIGSGTAGAVGAFAVLTTTVWGATRAFQALGTTLKLSAGPAGWILLAASAALSLAAGMKTAQLHTQAARRALVDFGTTEDVTRELEKVRAEIEEIERAMQVDLTKPEQGGPQIRFVAEGELDRLREFEAELVARLQRIADEEAEMQKVLDGLGDAFADLGGDVRSLDDILRDHEERLRVSSDLAKLLGDNYDLAAEELAAFERTIVDAVEAGFTHEQAILDIASAYIQMAEAARRANEETTRMIAPLSDLMRHADIMQLRMDLGMPLDVRGDHFLGDLPQDVQWQAWRVLSNIAGELRAEFERLVDEGEDFSESALEILRSLARITDLVNRLEDQLRTEPMAPVTPANVRSLGPSPMGSIHEARLNEFLDQTNESFRLLAQQIEAGIVPIDEGIRRLVEWRSGIIQLAQPLGGMAQLSEEQLRAYNDLNRSLEQWLASLESLPSRLDQIRADLEHSLGVGMAVDREIALATRGEFDPIAYEIDVLQRALREMATETGGITPEMQEYLRRLRLLSAEHEHLAFTEGLVRSALDSLGGKFGDLGRLVSRSVTFQPGQGLGGFGFDPRGFMSGALGLGIGMAFDALTDMSKSGEVLERAAEALQRASESWNRTLSEGQFHELVGATPVDTINEFQRIRREIQSEMSAIERWGVWPWERATYEDLRRQLREVNQEIQDLQNTAGEQIAARMNEVLGIGTRSLQGAISGAFGASTAEDFATNIGAALEGRIRSAWVTAFLESSTMAPLFESLGDHIREALLDIDISPDEMEGIRAIMDEIRDQSAPLYDLLDEFGLLAESTDRLNREFARLVNVPIGFRALQALRFQSMTPAVVPTFHGGGVMGHDGLANLRRGEVIFTPEQIAMLGGASSPIHIGQVVLPSVTNAEQFERELRALNRRDALRRTSNPTALQRVGR